MKKSLTTKMSMLLAAFVVCVLATCLSLPVNAAAGPLKQSTGISENYPTTRYVYLESTTNLGTTVDLKYSTTDATVANGTATQASYLGTLDGGRYVYLVRATFAAGSDVYFKYGTTDAFHAVTAPAYSATLSQVDATSDAAVVSWTPVAGATGYDLYLGSNEKDVQYIGTVADTSFTIGGMGVDGIRGFMVIPSKANKAGVNISWPGNATFKAVVSAPGKITGVKLADAATYTDEYMVTWSEAGAYTSTGFEVRIVNGKNKKITSAIENNKLGYIFKNSKLTTQGWKVRVRAYTTMDNGKKVYGAWSKDKVVVPYARVKSAKLSGSSNVKITWKKVKDAKNYTVYKKTSANGKFKKVKTVKGTSLTLTGIPKYKTQYVIVKPNKVKVGSKRYNATNVANPDSYKFQIVTKYY